MCVLLALLVIFYLLNQHLFYSAIRIFQGWHRTVNLPCHLRWARKGEVFTDFPITALCGWNSFQGSGVLLSTHLHFLISCGPVLSRLQKDFIPYHQINPNMFRNVLKYVTQMYHHSGTAGPAMWPLPSCDTRNMRTVHRTAPASSLTPMWMLRIPSMPFAMMIQVNTFSVYMKKKLASSIVKLVNYK